jgi:RHS repeat-associated protein
MLTNIARRSFAVAVTTLAWMAAAQLAVGSPKAILDSPTAPAKTADSKKPAIDQTDASVSTQTGALQYAYPIVVPPGRLGVEPNLALTYSSQAPTYGGIAAGWSLSGLPEIRVDVSEGMQTYAYLPWSEDPRNFISTMAGDHRLIPVTEDASPAEVTATYRAQFDTSYSQYQRMAPSVDYVWRVRSPDGMIYQFGHADHVAFGLRGDAWPLTRTVDKFGNAVEYYWSSSSGDYTLLSIDYTTNPTVSGPHARVELAYDGPEHCPGSSVPIGARLDYRTRSKRYFGAAKLKYIQTSAYRPSSGTLRPVRKIELGYDSNAESCNGKHGPQRQLVSIQETAWDDALETTVLPPTTFEYGELEPDISVVTPHTVPMAPGSPDALVWGHRRGEFEDHGWPTVEAQLLDINGDGFLDRLENAPTSSPSGTVCGFDWTQGTPNGFGGPVGHIELPTLPWSGHIQEECALNAQKVYFDHFGDNLDCYPIGSYFAYRYLDMDGDNLPDLVAALHYDHRHVTPDAGLFGAIGLPSPASCTPGDPPCPDPIDDCTSVGISCQQGVCAMDELAMRACVVDSPRARCDVLFAEDDSDVGDDTGGCVPMPECLVEPAPPGDSSGVVDYDVYIPEEMRPPGDEETPRCANNTIGRTGHWWCDGKFVWYWYRNEGNASFATTPQVVLSPVPLENDAGDSSLGSASVGYSTANHGIQDLNGDGFLDVYSVRRNSFEGTGGTDAWWHVWFGDGNGAFLGVGDNPYIWPAPIGIPPSDALTGAGVSVDEFGEETAVRLAFTETGMFDVNADGLPDLVTRNYDEHKNRVYLNNGLGFLSPDLEWSHLADSMDHLGYSIALIADFDQKLAELPTDAYRRTLSAPLDYDGDGRVDWFSPVKTVSAGWVPMFLMNGGDGLVNEIEIDELEYDRLQELLLTDDGLWKVTLRVVDLTGDGRNDYFRTFPGNQLVTHKDEGKPARLLHTIENGRGQTVNVRYAVHTDSNVVTQDVAAGKAMPNHVWVVKSLERDDTWSADATTTYKYIHPISNRDWLGKHSFRGFEKVQATGPLGTITVDSYDYAVDWSGRLAGSAVFADAAALAADTPHTMSETGWAEYRLFDDDLVTFHPATSIQWTCLDGMTRADCEDNGAQLHTTSTWEPTPRADPQPSLHAEVETRVTTCAEEGLSPEPPGEGELPPGCDGRREIRAFELDATATTYRLRQLTSERRTIPDDDLLGATSHVYDPSGRVVVQTDVRVSEAPEVWAKTVKTYYMQTGQLRTVQKPQQVFDGMPLVTTFAYDAFEVHVAQTSNEVGHLVETDYDYGTGAQIATRGPNHADCGGTCDADEQSITIVDGFGRVREHWVTVDDATEGYVLEKVAVTDYVDADVAAGEPAKEIAKQRVQASDWTLSETDFDGAGRVVRTESHAFDGGVNAVQTATYDAAGNVVAFTVPDPSADDTSTATYTIAYDSLGRIVSTRRPDMTGVDIAYVDPEDPSALLVETRTQFVPKTMSRSNEPIGETVTRKDAFGRLVEVKEKVSFGGYASTSYEHDGNDNLVKVIDADGILTDLEHDLTGNRTRIVRGAREWLYAYDRNGNVVQQIAPHPAGADAALYTISSVYDDLDRVESQFAGVRNLSAAEITALGADAITDMTYDTAKNGIGRTADVSIGSHAGASYDYDARGNLVEETRHFDLSSLGYPLSDERTIARTYNFLNQPAVVLHADGPSLTKSSASATLYDRRGLIDTVQWLEAGTSTPVELVDIERNVAGNVIAHESPYVERQWSYDVLGRVTFDQATTRGGVQHTEAVSYYGMDDIFALQTSRAGAGDFSFQFGYDAQHQLVQASTGKGSVVDYTNKLEYSPGGRVERARVQASSWAPLVHDRDVLYDYTGASDPQAVDTLVNVRDGRTYTHYAYNEAGGVTSRNLPGSGQWQFAYDGYDRQRRVTTPSLAKEHYYYGPGGQRWLALELDRTGVPQKLRFWFDETEVWYDAAATPIRTWAHIDAGTPLARIEDTTHLEYTFHNGLGHLMAAYSPTGGVEAEYIYGPFGEIVAQTGDTAEHLRRFNGKDYDATSDLSYYGHRYYDARSLSWTRGDPLFRFAPDLAYDEPRRMNLYAFSLNNPLRYMDPDGLQNRPTSVPADVQAMQQDFDEVPDQIRHGAIIGAAVIGEVARAAAPEVPRILIPGYAFVEAVINDDWAGAAEEAAWTAAGFGLAKGLQAAGKGFAKLFGKADDIVDTARHGDEVAEGLGKAERALGDELTSLAKQSSKKLPATSVGAYNPRTGRAAADSSFRGCCAEIGAADKVGGDAADVIFTKPVRPRTGKVVPVCKNCQTTFGRNQFPTGTPFED